MIGTYKRILNSIGLFFTKSAPASGGGLGIVLFSKDRPMQLEALLESIKQCISGDCQIVIQWQTSSADFEKAYGQVLKKYSDIIFEHVKETNFKSDLINVVKNIKFSRLMFLVDDILFVNPFSIEWLNDIDLRKNVPSIRLWSGINYTQPSDSISPAPYLSPFAMEPWSSFSWMESSGYWSMPLAVDGNVFDTKEILFLLERTQFKAPNTLEKAFGPYRFKFKYRKGLCLQHPIILNFALNRVNIENNDFACGDEYTSEKLLDLWHLGYRIDIKEMQKIKANSCHIICEPLFKELNC
ncbi:hypothetical protein QO200_08055 [Flavobacterium sp. Arc3]|uniref:hypothetical protein n=1 Tax=Flavobacterium sp. Arc3 TaxID=3046686 RepID=UPI00352CE584